MNTQEKSPQQNSDFFKTIFYETLNNNGGFIEIRISTEMGHFKSYFFENVDQLLKNLPSYSQSDIYFGVAPRKLHSGRKEFINFVTCLWIDIDYGKIGHRKACKYSTKEEAIAAINKFPIVPSYVVSSGNGFHLYWLLRSPTTNIQLVENCNKKLIRLLSGDPGTHNIDRILRVPGTINHKDQNNPKKVEIIFSHPDYKYTIDDFELLNLKNTCPDLEEKLLKLSSKTQTLIQTGACENYDFPSRSEADFRVICEMMRSSWSDKEIKEIFDTYPIGEKHRQNKSYLKYTITKCRSKIIPLPKEAIINGKPVPAKIAQWLIDRDLIIYSNNQFYEYLEGYYHSVDNKQIGKRITDALNDEYGSHLITNIINMIEIKSFKEAYLLNSSPYLNLNNGLLDPPTLTLHPHSYDILSTIRVTISFDPNAKCPIFERTLSQIFMDDNEKIETFLEFTGLCLTQDTRYQKCLLLVGEGANGKSVLLNTIKNLLGTHNCSTIPLERFSNSHYLAGLFGKLANICIEAPTKGEISDSIFKAIVAGDEITADHKYGQPFQFRPFCKLLFAINNLPRVDDKSDGYFRRLLIIRCQRQFSEKEQNKNLENELKSELPGILNLALQGLARLKNRGYFKKSESMEQELEEYRKENNSARFFIEEEGLISPNFTILTRDLYLAYSYWCKENGYHALSKRNFGVEVKRAYPQVTASRNNKNRFWQGITTEGFPLTDPENKWDL